MAKSMSANPKKKKKKKKNQMSGRSGISESGFYVTNNILTCCTSNSSHKL